MFAYFQILSTVNTFYTSKIFVCPHSCVKKMQIILLAHNSSSLKFSSNCAPANAILWDTKKMDHSPCDNPQIILISSSLPRFSAQAQQFILHQHEFFGVPILFFPYPCTPNYQLLLLAKYHPLQFEEEQKWQNGKISIGFEIVQAKHPIVQANLLECSHGYRDATRAKEQSTVIATWDDGAPLICELNNVVCLNFSMTTAKNATKLVQQTIDYMLKRRRKFWNLFPICSMYTDVLLVVT